MAAANAKAKKSKSAHRITADVAIVGAGPVGLMIANTLGLYGVRVVLIEKLEEIIDYPAVPVPGAVLPECPVTLAGGNEPHEGHLTDLVQPCFTAFYFAEEPTLPADLRGLAATLAQRGIPFKLVPVTRHLGAAGSVPHGWDHTGRLFTIYGAQPGTLYLVRPDGHVLALWREANVTEMVAAIEHALHP